MTETADPATPQCPFCGETTRVTLVSRIGGQIITAQWHCDSCSSYFEAIRDEFDSP